MPPTRLMKVTYFVTLAIFAGIPLANVLFHHLIDLPMLRAVRGYVVVEQLPTWYLLARKVLFNVSLFGAIGAFFAFFASAVLNEKMPSRRPNRAPTKLETFIWARRGGVLLFLLCGAMSLLMTAILGFHRVAHDPVSQIKESYEQEMKPLVKRLDSFHPGEEPAPLLPPPHSKGVVYWTARSLLRKSPGKIEPPPVPLDFVPAKLSEVQLVFFIDGQSGIAPWKRVYALEPDTLRVVARSPVLWGTPAGPDPGPPSFPGMERKGPFGKDPELSSVLAIVRHMVMGGESVPQTGVSLQMGTSVPTRIQSNEVLKEGGSAAVLESGKAFVEKEGASVLESGKAPMEKGSSSVQALKAAALADRAKNAI